MKRVRVYYYSPFLTKEFLNFLQKGIIPLHSYYGLHYFDDNIEVIVHKVSSSHPNRLFSRLLRNISNVLKILKAYQKYDLIYVTNARGIKLLAFLRALKIFPKPVCMLIHWAVIIPDNKLKRPFSKLYIKGFDHLFFFSEELLNLSIKTGWIKTGKALHWGGDLDYYSKIGNVNLQQDKMAFLSTGTEKRDFNTVCAAFTKAKQPLKCYVTEIHNGIDYVSFFKTFEFDKSLIDIVLLKKRINLIEQTIWANCIVIPLLPFKKGKIYPCGLTSLVEAMTLAKPVIITDNPYNGIDVEKIGCGIKVAYSDIDGWVNAIKYIADNKEIAINMGKKGYDFIKSQYNIKVFGKELSSYFTKIHRTS
jgi:glycosyltransferase involved in cell wall biosynthesis